MTIWFRGLNILQAVFCLGLLIIAITVDAVAVAQETDNQQGPAASTTSSKPEDALPKFAPKQDKLPVTPPRGATVLFDGRGTHNFLSMAGGPIDWATEDGTLISARSKRRSNHLVSGLHFRDADMHVEFMLPDKGTGNSGIYIHGNYEMQIFNSHGKEQLDQGDMGALYGFAKPLVNAARKPGEWQVYDIRYRAPRRDETGKIVEEGSITAWLNGQQVQDNTRFGEPRSKYHPFRYGTTPYLQTIWKRQLQTSTGPVFLQDHDNPVRFRNVWVKPLDKLAFHYVDGMTAEPLAGMGVMVGEVTAGSALVQVRLTRSDKCVAGDVTGAAGVVEFVLQPSDASKESATANSITQTIPAMAERDFIARAAFKNLSAGTNYVCTTRIGSKAESLREGPVATFKTHPGPKSADTVRFVVVTGMNYGKFHGDDRIDRKRHLTDNNTKLPKPYAGLDKQLGYPGLASILKLKPHFFVGTGDNVYYDTPKDPRAETIPEMRQKWHEQFVQPRYRDLFAAVPTYWEIDDHDYRIDDGDNTGDHKPSPEMGRKVMLEQLPVAPAENEEQAKTYRTHRVSRDLQVWFTENRMYRSPNSMPDGPKKSIWGTEQKSWLQRTLRDSDAKFKILISPTPMIGPDDRRKTDNHTNIGGFRYERDEFFAWLKVSGVARQENFYIVCGDRHWQYHSVHPTGIEEFSCGALVDANSRLGRKPGDPLSTDPNGLIKQVYAQKTRSGGFLLITVAPAADRGNAALEFAWYDEFGKLLHKHKK